MTHQNTAIIAVSRQGVEQGQRLAAAWPGAALWVSPRWLAASPQALSLGDSLAAAMPDIFHRYDKLVFFLATGAVVRLIAPLLRDKFSDPAIVVVDGAARFAISLLSGHIGGANALALAVGRQLNAQPVITTASDVAGICAVDLLGREQGWRPEATPEALRQAASHMVNGDAVALVMEEGEISPANLPPWVTVLTTVEPEQLGSFQAVLWVTHRPSATVADLQLPGVVVLYRPPLVLGIGCDRGTSQESIQSAILHAGVSLADVREVATIDRKGDEVGLLGLVAAQGWPLRLFTAEALNGVVTPNPSETVRRHMGVASVAEAAALLAADQGRLVIQKFCYRGRDGRNVTVAAARKKHG